MLLLITDTSGKNGAVALARANADARDVTVLASAPLIGGTFSAQLIPQISALLEQQRLTKRDIDAFVVVSGPGSFTGLRVGLAAIKALAEILAKPIVPVSLLEVIAVAANQTGKVAAAFDAGRGEVYSGLYEINSTAATLQWEKLMPRDQLMSTIQDALLVTTDPFLSETAKNAGNSALLLEKVTPEMIAALGSQKLAAGATVTPEGLDANYLRRTDAEILLNPTAS